MSPAVSTATATAAAAMAPTPRRKVTLPQTRPAGMSSSADSSSSGSIVRKPTPIRKTTQGKQASAWMIAAPVRPTRTGRSPIACIRPALPSAPSQAVACKGKGTNAAMPSIPRSSPRPQMSVRNRSKARRIPGGRTRAAVMNTRESVSTASRAGRPRPPVSRSKRAVAAGSSTLPVAGSGSMFHTRRIRSAQSSSPREASARSSRCGARHASRTVAASGQPTRTTSDPSSASAASQRDILLMVAVRPWRKSAAVLS